MATVTKPKVAINRAIFNKLPDFPKRIQKKIGDTIDKFMSNPRASGLNYETIKNAANDNYRSIRVTQDYRAIILKPSQGNVYMFLWVDKHDDAYSWAERTNVIIHPEKGNIQVYSTQEAQQQLEREKEELPQETPGLFDDIRDRKLITLGIPEDLLGIINQIKNEEMLEGLGQHLPEEVQEILYGLAAGMSPQEVDQALAVSGQSDEIDPEDFESAIETARSRREFLVVEDEKELEEMLHAPLDQWRVFLHPSQRELVDLNAEGPVRVLGGAGTGKTVVAMHRARYLVKNVLKGENKKVLFTTFTKNLAADIKVNLKKICDKKTLSKIEIINFDQWVWSFLRNNGYAENYNIKYKTDEYWEDAITLAPPELPYSDQFYRNEWEQIIQPHDVMSEEDYLKVPRIGAVTDLDREERKQIWPIFDEYRTLLDQKNVKEIDDAMRDARMLLKEKGDVLPYRSIVVDEAQDMGAQAFKLMRQMVPEQANDLFIVGDAHQRIYRAQAQLSHCGISIDERDYKLRINYRTSDENRKAAVKLLQDSFVDNLDGEYDPLNGYRSLFHGYEPLIINKESFQEEVKAIDDYLQQFAEEELKSVCLVARLDDLLMEYAGALKMNGYETYRIKRREAEDRSQPGIRLATMHRVKGIEFENVIIAGANKGIIPLGLRLRGVTDNSIKTEIETQERALLHVAMTRAKGEVLITTSGEPSPFLEDLENE